MAEIRKGQKKYVTLNDFRFECGRQIEKVQVCYETWGRLNSRGDNAILICHALSGTSHAGNSGDGGGWWDVLIGPGKAFDTQKYFVICSNALGGCSGSSGPSSIHPHTGERYALSFPMVTIRDMVRAQRQLLDQIGVRRLRTISGGSMGGMQAFEWAAQFPEVVDSIIAMATPGRAYPQSIAYRKAQRKAIMMDPNWRQGNYYHNGVPRDGIELARHIGFISYRTEREFADRFGRDFVDDEPLSLTGRFAIEEYLEHHGKKLADWFDANTYLYFSKAMDLHDLGHSCPSYEAGVQRIKAAACIIGFDSDLLFPAYQQREVVAILGQTNANIRYHEIKTIYGHDAFLLEHEQLTPVIAEFLSDLAQVPRTLKVPGTSRAPRSFTRALTD
ncbi:MAG TPA: homoserine O-acetyltransferase [bacterium]